VISLRTGTTKEGRASGQCDSPGAHAGTDRVEASRARDGTDVNSGGTAGGVGVFAAVTIKDTHVQN
jgi:hypothetical protein